MYGWSYKLDECLGFMCEWNEGFEHGKYISVDVQPNKLTIIMDGEKAYDSR